MIAYLDCFSGISGDMTLAAFIDLGVPVEFLKQEIARLPLEGFSLSCADTLKNGLHAKDVVVSDLEGLHPRNYTHIHSLISKSPLSSTVRKNSLAMFEKIAVAESHIHGCPMESVHFHEVGGIDTIVDIVGTALCVEYLGIHTVVCSRLPLGHGFVTCSHGRIPLPAPAVLAILKDAPVTGTEMRHETVTPTGAAIARTLAHTFGPMPAMRIRDVGYGAGKKETSPTPNLLRIVLGEPDPVIEDQTWVIEATIDDMSPEIFGFVMDRLLEEGALDVCFIPVFMKKNRPGTQIQVIAAERRKERLVRILFEETTTIGVRHYPVTRHVLPRKAVQVATSLGTIAVKQIMDPSGRAKQIPEFESLKAIAREKNMPLKDVYQCVYKEL